MEKNIIETIEKNVQEMKRMRKSLRNQLNELFGAIENFCEKEDIEIEFQYGKNEFSIKKAAYGFAPGHNANGSMFRFMQQSRYEEEGRKGFTDDMHAQYISWNNFTNEDVIYLARNIKEILQVINEKLENKLSELQECQKYLQ